MAGNPNRAARTEKLYLEQFARYLGDWQLRPLDSITRRDVEDRFGRLTEDHGWACANRGISLLGSIYRRPCVDFEGLRNPVELWRAGGGKYHRPKRRKISAPAEVLPRWRAGIEALVATPKVRDAFWFGLYTGMRLNEVLSLQWERVDMAGLVFRVDETKTGEPLELPITRQLAAILERRNRESETLPGNLRGWVFPSSARAGHISDLSQFYARIGTAGGTKFWYHALRNCFITVAERDLLLPLSLTCQWRSKKGPPRRCKKGPLGGCGLVPVVHGRAPRATRRALNRLTRRRAREGPVGPRGQAWAGWSVQLAVGV